MATTMNVGQTATALLREFRASGVEVPPVGPVTHSSDNTAVATVSGDQVTAVGPGTCNITGSDAGNGLSASASLEVQDNSPATTATETLTVNP